MAGAEAVLISGTGMPTAGIIERLERDLGKPVVTSQQASLWCALRLIRRLTRRSLTVVSWSRAGRALSP